MTDFEGIESGHEHVQSCGFEDLDSKSTWSSFDEITWGGFGGDDHSVPDPDEPSEPLWLRGSTCRRREAKPMKEDTKMEEDSSMDVDNWEDLDVSELGAVPESLIPENALIGTELKEGSPDGLLTAGLLDGQVFNDEDASIVTSSGPFPYVPTEEDLELFGGEDEVDKGETLLDYNWESLQDMDNLFQNEESTFGPDAADALLQWASTASSPDSNAPVPASLSPELRPELRAMKGKLQDQDVKMEFIPCDTFEKSTSIGEAAKSETVVELCAKNSEVNKALDEQELAVEKLSADVVEDTMRPFTSQRGKEQRTQDVEKAHTTMKRQTSSRRREDRSKKIVYSSSKKAGQNLIQPKPQTLTHYSSAQVKPTVAATLQVYPQVHGSGIPAAMMGVSPAMQQRQSYLHSHSSMGSVHHSPYVIQGQVHQPVMMCYDHPDQRQQYEQQKQLEVLGPPPASGANMTPQEKLDKLRWKQKMQRLASDQQQQIVKPCISIEQPSGKLPVQKPIKGHGKQQPELETVNSPVIKPDEAEERAVEATVLNQLLDIMTKKLDVGTRMCIRDALYRLSKGALNRHATDGASSSECSNTVGDQSLSRTIRYPMLETPTNPIDRSIINLLFRRNTGTMLSLPSLPAATRTRPDWTSWQGGAVAPGVETMTEGKGKQHQHQHQHQQQQQQHTLKLQHQQQLLKQEKGTAGDQSADVSSDDMSSEGSSRKPKLSELDKAVTKAGDMKSPRGSLKRAASYEFLSSQEDIRGGRGTSSSSDSPRDGKAAKTGSQ